MELKINLEEVLGGEGALADLVSEHVNQVVRDGVGKKIDAALSIAIRETIDEAIKEKMPSLIDDVLNTPYVKVDRYGSRASAPTTFRKELVEAINEEMKYKKEGYSSRDNVFTQAVNSVVESQVTKFKTEFNKQVDASFVSEAMAYATKKLQERLGVK